MNIIKRELRANLKALIIWAVSLTLVIFAASAEYSAFVDNPEILDAMSSFEEMFAVMGMPVTDFSTPEGFISMFSIYFYVPLSIYGALLGSSIISKEERDKTAEYLFTLPVKRNQVLVKKLIAATIYMIIFVFYILAISTLFFSRYSLDDTFYYFMRNLFVGLIFTSFIFMSIGMFLASVLRQYKKSGSITLAILIGSYLLNVLIGLVEELEFLKYINPFQYFKVDAMLEGNIELKYILISIGIIASCITGLFVFYKKRDLYI